MVIPISGKLPYQKNTINNKLIGKRLTISQIDMSQKGISNFQ